MITINLPNFGIFEDSDGVRNLYQDLCPYGFNYVGVKSRSNLSVKGIKARCPHAMVPTLGLREVPAKHWKKFMTFFNDELVQAMLPLPNPSGHQAVYLDQEVFGSESSAYLSCLERMSTPMQRSVIPLWTASDRAIQAHLALSNIHPLVIFGAKEGDGPRVANLLEASVCLPRKLIVVGTKKIALPKTTPRISSNLKNLVPLDQLISLPMEHIGCEIIKRYCRREKIYGIMRKD